MEASMEMLDEEEEETVGVIALMIHWRVTGAGCVAIWPVTIPNLGRHRVLVQTVLKMHHHSNLGVEAQGEVEGGRSGLVEWV